MKYILVMAMALFLAGCERETDRQTSARYSDSGQYRMDIAGEACKNGVMYYVTFYDRSITIAPAFNTDSTVRLCNK
ncbi:hypothetical protein D3C76_705250 [compost metagenome]